MQKYLAILFLNTHYELLSQILIHLFFLVGDCWFLENCVRKSIGTGKMIVEFFSAAIELIVWNKRYWLAKMECIFNVKAFSKHAGCIFILFSLRGCWNFALCCLCRRTELDPYQSIIAWADIFQILKSRKQEENSSWLIAHLISRKAHYAWNIRLIRDRAINLLPRRRKLQRRPFQSWPKLA